MKEDSDAVIYRQRAEQLREIADKIGERKSKQTILEIAEEYERMARSLERTEKSDRSRKF